MEALRTSQLSTEQLAVFNIESITDDRWALIRPRIDEDFPGGEFNFVDLGGGNGLFADRVLAEYPKSRGAVLDSSDLLLSKNRPHSRKTVTFGNALDFANHFSEVDIVFCNWIFHHLVHSSSYARSRENVRNTLTAIRSRMTKRGRLSVYETDYNGYISWFPGRLIFALTSSRALAPFVKRLGANTAGVGVCFQSSKQWHQTFENCGFHVLSHAAEKPWWWWSTFRHTCLLLRDVSHAHYWAK